MDKNDPRRPPSEEELDELNRLWNEPGDPDGVVAAEKQQRRQAQHPSAPLAKPKKRHPFIKFLIIIIVIAAAAYGAFWFGDNRASHDTAPATTTTKPVTKTVTPTTPQTKHYDSTNFSLGIDYPTGWKLTDTTSKLTIASTPYQLKSVDGQTKSLHVLLTIQNKQTSIDGYPASGAYAELESDKLTYKQPTQIQRAQTYVSYLGYHKTNGLDAIYVTGDNGYMQNQLVPLTDVTISSTLVGVGFVSCTSDDCAIGTTTPATLLASGWKSSNQSKQVTALIESIAFQ